jgi:hypothetical protein
MEKVAIFLSNGAIAHTNSFFTFHLGSQKLAFSKSFSSQNEHHTLAIHCDRQKWGPPYPKLRAKCKNFLFEFSENERRAPRPPPVPVCRHRQLSKALKRKILFRLFSAKK